MMSGTRCAECEKITIERLLDLATSRLGYLSPSSVPEIFHEHHKSLADLEHAANEGCGFCGLVIDCLRGYAPNHENRWWRGEESAENWSGDRKLKESLLTAAKRFESSVVSVWVTPPYSRWSKLRSGSGLADLEQLAEIEAVHDLFVQIGNQKTGGYSSQMPILRFNITTPRRRCTTLIVGSR